MVCTAVLCCAVLFWLTPFCPLVWRPQPRRLALLWWPLHEPFASTCT